MDALHVSPYLLLNGLGLIIGLLLVDRRLEERIPHRRDCAYVLFVLSVGVGWFGAHVLAWIVGSQSFGQAGFAFYGGLVAGLAFLAASSWLSAFRFGDIITAVDAAVVPFLVAHGVGRIGCFLAGCCYGAPIPGTNIRYPTQLYESVFLFLVAWVLSKRRQDLPFGDVLAYLTCYPVFRFLVEFLRDDPRGDALGLSTSQWISLVLLIVACLLYVRRRELARKVLQTATAGDICCAHTAKPVGV